MNNTDSPLARSPLFAAIKEKNLEIVRLLLNNHADPNLESYTRDTPMSCAVHEVWQANINCAVHEVWQDKKPIVQSIEILLMLLKAGGDPNVQSGASLTTPLRSFVLGRILRGMKHEHVVFLVLTMLQAGADKNIKDSCGITPSAGAREYSLRYGCGLNELADMIDYWPGENLQERILFSLLKRLCSPLEKESTLALYQILYLLNACPHNIMFFQRFGVVDLLKRRVKAWIKSKGFLRIRQRSLSF